MLDPKQILKLAQAGHYAVGSFNFSTAEVLKAIVAAAKETNSPAIISTSQNEADFIGIREAAALVEAWRQATKLPLILNLDHGKDPEEIKKAVAAGYNAIHFDGSEFSYEENIRKTKEVVEYIRRVEKTFDRSILVEGELGYLTGSSSLNDKALEIKTEDLTSPEQALDFIEKTGIDSLAVVIGNAHGIFTKSEEKLDLGRLAEIREAVGERVFLVLHGGSGIPQDDVRKAIELGIAKVNVNTELRVAYKESLEKEIKERPKETTPYKILSPALEAVKKVVKEKIEVFGCGGKI
jgi:ketose-bisphosphate aldolase